MSVLDSSFHNLKKQCANKILFLFSYLYHLDEGWVKADPHEHST